MRSIFIRISNRGVSLGNDLKISLQDTNLPVEHFRFKESKPIYWEVEMISFIKSEYRLKVKVIDYKPETTDKFKNQVAKYNIQHIHFEKLHWTEFQSFLSTYQKKELLKIITDEKFIKLNLKSIFIPLKISLKQLSFQLGYAEFAHTFKWNPEVKLHRISKADSIPEYNFIKPYFKKILGKASIDVVIEVESTSESMRIKSVKSKDLSEINDESIRILKVQKFEQWYSKKPKFAPPDQDLFTFEEAMESYGDEALGNIDIFEKDLLFHLLEKENVRNRMQLHYLSDRIHERNEKLLMTLVPQFGFVFIHKGDEMTHYIWELLNSHATYVWSMPIRDKEIAIKKIEQEVRTINIQGRTAYRSNFENSDALFFNVLIHKTGNYSYEQYFARWKHNLDNLLI